MKKKFYYLLILAFLTFFIPACSSSDEEPKVENEEQTDSEEEKGNEEEKKEWEDDGMSNNPRKYITLSRAEEELAALNTDFAFRYLQVSNEALASNGNMLLSPQSASFALSMLGNGAAGKTLDEILDVLGFNKFTLDEMNGYNQKLMKELGGLDNTTTMNFANSLWMDDVFNVLGGYKQAMKDAYQAEVNVLDFNQSTAKDKINQWCSDKTNGRIAHFLDEWNPDVKAMLINALYFKGKWYSQFKKDKTEEGSFTTASGESENVDYMRQTINFQYIKNEKVSVVEFPYGNYAFRMYVVLPHEGVSLDEWIKDLSSAQWETMLNDMKAQWLDIWLPKFRIEWKDAITGILEKMGMQKAFDKEEADFSSLSDEHFFVYDILQATYLNVDEGGTEGAAVTGNTDITADLEDDKDQEKKVVEFRANHPFLFIIQEESTGSVLFLGKFVGTDN